MKLSIDKEEINKLPIISFSGPIELITDPGHCENALRDLEGEAVLGFDTETRPAYKKGVKHEVSLLQLSTDSRVFMFRLNKISFAGVLKDIMADEAIVKAGVAVRDDIKALQRLHSFKAGGFVELADLARSLEIKNFGLRSLTALLLHKRVSKQNKLTNWENPVLTAEQQRYAATDAWLSLKLYQRMLELKQSETKPDLP